MKSFHSIDAFSRHVEKLIFEQPLHQHEMLERAGKMVEGTAKAKFGEYQEQEGPLVAWAELAESTKADRARQGYPEDKPLLRDGTERDSIHHRASFTEANIGSDSEILEMLELGTSKMPPRSTLGGALVEDSRKIVEMFGADTTGSLAGAGVVGGGLKLIE